MLRAGRLAPAFLLALLLSPLGAAGGAAPANADDTALQIVGPPRPPYIVDRNGTGIGPAAELMIPLARAIGIDPRVRILPFRRAVLALDQGGTLYPALLRTPARERKYNWIGEVFTDQAVFFTRAGMPAIGDLTAAERLERISVMRGSELQSTLHSYALGNVETNTSEADNARLLQAGRIDGWFTLKAVGYASWQELGFDPAALGVSRSFAAMSFWIAASADLPPQTVAKLREAYRRLRRDGRYRQIVAPLAKPPS